MKCIVTGGYGFIGSHLIRRLVADGYQVVNIDKETYAANPEFLKDIETRYIDPEHLIDLKGMETDTLTTVKADICKYFVNSVFDIFQPDIIFHLAAESHVDNSIRSSEVFMHTNIMGTHNLLQIVKNHGNKTKFVHVSTDEVYGSVAVGAFTEQTPYDPRSPYSASKAASDFLVKAWFNTYQTPAVITHCSNNYGPNQQFEKFIPTIITKAMKGEPVPVYGEGANVRDWLWVGDHVDGLIQAGLHGIPGETYNIGGGQEYTNLDLARYICRMIPGNHKLQFVKDRQGHDYRYAIDNTKISKELGWSPVKSFEEGISETIGWYQKWNTKELS